ncbi:MAG: AIPR family protein [Nitrosopumilus sp.]|uniref:AIPR family protein n=1 Tax=Nitrosopumilus sp. TaxID=2024843 RepID=UPI00246A6855|nr:AIPR family protein [Nitrosopumilus sp.]MDH5431114.1 AIPR family protein [Nitrosopumilus sp.]
MPAEFIEPSDNFIESVKHGIENEVLKGQNSVEKGRLFLEWILTKAFHATEDDAENGTLDGPNDMGIDAILEIRGSEMNFFRIFQSKFGTSHSMDSIETFKSKINTLLETSPNELPEGRIRDALIDIKRKGWDWEAIYVTDQKVTYRDTENFHVFGIDEIVKKLWNEITEPFDDKSELVTLENLMEFDKTIIGVISLSELGQLVNRSGKYIFESNIRKFLPVKTKVNKQLRKSLLEEPEEVFYYNNGVTIVVKDFDLLGDAKIKLVAPQIVNGAQTSTTIADVVKGDPLIKGAIQITIIKEDTRTTRNNITKFRNSQNAVKGRDLISLEKFHNVIGSQLSTKLGYYYEQQAGAWMAKSKQEKEIFRGDETFNKYLSENEDRIIPANDAIQAMAAAIEQNPAKPYGSISKYMPGGSEYTRIFSEGEIEDDYRLLLYPYLTKSYCEKKFNYGSQKANMPEKKYARLLFVTAYFQALTDHIIGKKVDLKKEPKSLDPYFENFDVNEKLLALIDEILDQFFDQTLHIRQDVEGRDIMTLHNFFANHVWNSESKTILKNIMKRKKDKFKEIKDLF